MDRRDYRQFFSLYSNALLSEPPQQFDLRSDGSAVLASLNKVRAVNGDTSAFEEFAFFLFRLRHYELCSSMLDLLGETQALNLLRAALEMALGTFKAEQQVPDRSTVESIFSRYGLAATVLFRDAGSLPKLFNLSLSETCFFRCAMCFKWDKKQAAAPSLATQQWQRIIDGLPFSEGATINFAGAEPLAYPGLPALIQQAKQRGFSTAICTNGYLLDRAMLDKLMEAGLDHIALSLDSLDANVHDELRGKIGAHARIMDALGILGTFKKSYRVELQPLIVRHNFKYLCEFVSFADSSEVIDGVNFLALVPPYERISSERWFAEEYQHLWPDDIDLLCEQLERHIAMRRRGSKISNAIAQLQTYQRYYKDPAAFAAKTKGCPMGTAFANINADGAVELCPYFSAHRPIGNALSQELSQLWQGPTAADVRAQMRQCDRNCHLILNCSFESEQLIQS